LLTYGISVYHHRRCEFEPRSWRGVLDPALSDNVSPGTSVSFINKTDRHDITELLVKVALSTIDLNVNHDFNTD